MRIIDSDKNGVFRFPVDVVGREVFYVSNSVAVSNPSLGVNSSVTVLQNASAKVISYAVVVDESDEIYEDE